jgi:hypothetical protein
VITIAVLVLVIALGAAVYWNTRGEQPKTASGATQEGAGNAPVADDRPVPTKQYDSTKMALGFDYPETWKVTEDASGKITVTAPVTQLMGVNGQQQQGRAVVTISPKGQNLTPFDAGNATAVSDSVKIKYTKPSSAQRAETYSSFAQYAATTATGALDGVYITGDFGYQKGQAIPKTDMIKLDPVIAVTFDKCADAACAGAKPTNVQASTWDKSALAKTINTLLTSLSVN